MLEIIQTQDSCCPPLAARGTDTSLLGLVGALPPSDGAMTTLHALLSRSMEGGACRVWE